ncbi:hypothetical protein CDL12_13757 [Handroanthus impetiginosus]|uniref:Uncharacterized protein n=1 Tax=Handroanthus impetiginosus TaxID=429701 RepID=A0A2G9H8H8_9LAMI|nr:hypothetical protein CDL12_13757 [Handroanthus impetiginosus]
MADFLTDSDDEKAVEELLSQAMDMEILDQVAAINCAGFSDSGLPSHLETRFQNLKSFPSNSPNSKKISSVNEKGFSACLKKSPDSRNCLYPSKSSDIGSFSHFKKTPQKILGKKEIKFPTKKCVSPPAKSGCFLCIPKKVSGKKKKENRGLDLGLVWGKHDELLSDLSSFSVKNQEKMMKKAMEEEEKICREAEKIVKWAKNASARMDVSDIEDELSDQSARFDH